MSAYRARLDQAGLFAHIAHRGDETAGAILVKVATMDGNAALFGRAPSLDGPGAWEAVREACDEREVDAVIQRRVSSDRDLWVVEVEDPRGRHLLDEDGLT